MSFAPATATRPDEPRLDESQSHRNSAQSFVAQPEASPKEVDTSTANISLETLTEDFPKFWHWIGATGDLDTAMATRHNATKT